MLTQPQDLIYAAGLFDYLSDRRATAIINALFARLREGGLLVIGNVAAGCPIFTTEFLGDWSLRFRTRDEMARWASQLTHYHLSFRGVPSGTNHFMLLRKSA